MIAERRKTRGMPQQEWQSAVSQSKTSFFYEPRWFDLTVHSNLKTGCLKNGT
jgi:hypothetical protein